MADQTQNPNGNGKSGDSNVSLETILDDGAGKAFEQPKGDENQEGQKNKDPENQQQQNQQQNNNSNTDIKNQPTIFNDVNVKDLVLDAENNVIDSVSGKVIIPKEKVKFDNNENVIIPDDIQIGEGVKTIESDSDKSSLKALQETIGITPVDENGKKKKYSDDAAGLISYTTDIVKTAQETAVQEFLKANPTIQSFINHISNGGQPREFDEKIRYSSVQYNDKDENLNLNLIKADLIRKGNSKEDVDDMITLIKTNGTWATKGKTAYDNLVSNEKSLREADEKAARAAWEKEQKEAIKYWKQAEDLVVNKGVISDITIPIDDREEFFNYISKPIDKEGNSQFDMDYSESDQEKRMLLQYLVYKKMDFASLIEQKARTLAVRKLAESKKPQQSISIKRADFQKTNQHTPTIDDII